MNIEINRPETQALIDKRLQTGAFQTVEDVIFDALLLSEQRKPQEDARRLAAIQKLKVFGKENNLSLGDSNIRSLREEARP